MPYNYFNGYNNPYTGYVPYYQNNQQQRVPYQQMPYNTPNGLQGKTVDNIEVVKAIDIPLDGSTSYFPIADGSAIASKQLQQDGTSRITIYRPEVEGKQDKPQYITQSDLEAQFGELNPKDIKDIKEEIKSLKKKIRDISEDIEEKKVNS